ncbi:MAG: hypothetical protein LBK22_02940 [Tannerella sp.]|jgi:hypothetical protein|nr:hypothetical protein [Tannerella sp.]
MISCNSDKNEISGNETCETCGDRPQENLPWLKELIEKAKTDKTGNYLGSIWLEHYKGKDIFVTNMMLGSGGIANWFFDCSGAHCSDGEGSYCPSAFVGNRHFSIDDNDFWSHIECNADKASVIIYANQ